MKDMNAITIGVLAKSANVGVETIRFYERKDIIQQPPKVGGFRHYSAEDVRVVRLVKKLQSIGFTLDEIKEFLLVNHCCSESKQVIRQKSLDKIAELNQKIVELQGAVNALETFANTCGNNHNEASSCDLLDCFDNDWECCS